MEPNLRKFQFDAIIPRIEVDLGCPLNEEEEEEQCGEWELSMKDLTFQIESDRLLVVNFPRTPLYEFHTQPCDLCEALGKGLDLTVKVNGKQFGTGKCEIPNYILSQLFDETCMLTHIMECEIIRRKKVIGIIELSFRIQSGLPDKDAVNTLECGAYDVCRPLDKSINPRDLMLVLGRPARNPKMSCIAEKRLVTGVPPQPFICISPLSGPQNCQMGQAGLGKRPSHQSNQCQAHGNPMGPENFCKCTEMQTSTSSTMMSTAAGDYDDLQESILAENAKNFSQPSPRNFFAPCPSISPPDLFQTDFKTPRRCTICKEDLTWLPKLATCPYCTYKPLPDFDEIPYDEKTTAIQILHKFIQQPETESSMENDKECKVTDDTCKNKIDCTATKPCARCRIRKMCEDMLKVDKKTLKQLQLAKLTDKPPKPKKLPTLLEVFTDLKAKYEKKAMEVCPLKDNSPKKCPKTCKKQKSSKRKVKSKKDGKKKSICSKLKKREDKYKIKSRIYTSVPYRTESEKRLGHKNCLCDNSLGAYKRVPCDMGWLWKIDPKAIKNKNWKPGAISKPIRQIMAYFLTDYPADSLAISRYSCRLKASRRAHKSQTPDESGCEGTQPLQQRPTLHICKKDGEYIITLRPLKDADLLAKCPDPYMQMKPVQFRIAKDPKLIEKRKLKAALRDLGFNKCICNRPVVNCFCRSFVDKKLLLQEVNRQCKELKLKHPQDDFIMSESSESEQEYDFGVTPPAGLIKPYIKKKPDVVNSETQYDWKDWHMQYKFNPAAYSPFYWYSMCATGEKKKISPKKKKPKKPASKKKKGTKK